MARISNWRDFSPTLDAAKAWITNCLINDSSILSPHESLWTPAYIEEVRHAFVDNPDEGDDDFMTKLTKQLADCSPNSKKLAAEMLYALFLFPSNMGQQVKVNQVKQLWEGSGNPFPQSHYLNNCESACKNDPPIA